MKRIPLLLVFFAVALSASAKPLPTQYDGKFFVVLKDGLAIGVCQAPAVDQTMKSQGVIPTLAVRVNGDNVEYHPQTGITAMTTGCTAVVAEPIRKGEVLLATRGMTTKHELVLFLHNVAPHQITRGQGSFQHSTYEVGAMSLRFKLANPKDEAEQLAAVGEWLRQFDSQDEASTFSAQFGNTASGVFVKQVKAGMSFAETEQVLGPPETRVDLGDKVLYKYKDMTVEFHAGKVTDVR